MKVTTIPLEIYKCDFCDFSSKIRSSVEFHEMEHKCDHTRTVKNQYIYDNSAEYFDITTYCTKCRKILSCTSGMLKEENRYEFLSELEILVKKYAKLDDDEQKT